MRLKTKAAPMMTTAQCMFLAVLFALALATPFTIISSCGAQWDAEELTRIRAITCPSVCAAYADAVDAGKEISPEDEALIGVCECE